MTPYLGIDTIADYLKRKQLQEALQAPDETGAVPDPSLPTAPTAPPRALAPIIGPTQEMMQPPPTFQPPSTQLPSSPDLEAPTDSKGALAPSYRLNLGPDKPEMDLGAMGQPPIRSAPDLTLDSGAAIPPRGPKFTYDYRRPEEVQRYLTATTHGPNIQEYERKGIGRKILGVLGGVGTAALTNDPINSGEAMYQNITHPGYKQAYTGWQRQLAQLKPGADLSLKEEQDRIAYAKMAESEAKQEARERLNDAYMRRADAQAGLFNARATQIPLAHGQRMEEIGARNENKYIKGPFKVVVENEDGTKSTLDGATYNSDPRGKLPQGWYLNGKKIQGNVISHSDKEKTYSGKLGLMVNDFVATHNGRAPTGDEISQLLTRLEDPAGIKNSLRRTQMQLMSERIRLLQAVGTSPEDVARYVSLAEDNPDILYNLPTQLKGLVMQGMMKGGASVPGKSTPLQAALKRDAIVSLEHAPVILDLLDKPNVQAALGPFWGRIGNWEQALGDSILTTDDPQTKQDLQELRTRLGIFKAQETRVANAGGRASVQMQNMIRNITTRPDMGLDLMKGAMQAAVGSAQINLKSAQRMQYGNQPLPPKESGIPTSGGIESIRGKPVAPMNDTVVGPDGKPHARRMKDKNGMWRTYNPTDGLYHL